eukprot:3820476-Amphidinium_carterae.1
MLTRSDIQTPCLVPIPDLTNSEQVLLLFALRGAAVAVAFQAGSGLVQELVVPIEYAALDHNLLRLQADIDEQDSITSLVDRFPTKSSISEAHAIVA